MPEQQSFANHTRWYPLVHFVIMPALILNLLFQIVRLYQDPGLDRAVLVVLSIVFPLIMLASRLQALKVQDRVIRLEERVRYKELLGTEIAARACELPLSQMLALRFASDAELPELVAQVLNGTLTTGKEIKMAVKDWRADHLRA